MILTSIAVGWRQVIDRAPHAGLNEGCWHLHVAGVARMPLMLLVRLIRLGGLLDLVIRFIGLVEFVIRFIVGLIHRVVQLVVRLVVGLIRIVVEVQRNDRPQVSADMANVEVCTSHEVHYEHLWLQHRVGVQRHHEASVLVHYAC
jgi:hypothetical protein